VKNFRAEKCNSAVSTLDTSNSIILAVGCLTSIQTILQKFVFERQWGFMRKTMLDSVAIDCSQTAINTIFWVGWRTVLPGECIWNSC